jgi:hypothetical protein
MYSPQPLERRSDVRFARENARIGGKLYLEGDAPFSRISLSA